jgi:L-fuconolactonase
MIIDPHVHVWTDDPAFPIAEGQKFPPHDARVETLLQRMEEHGVEKTVLVQVIQYRWDNRYTAACMKRFPGTFEGVCRVDPESPSAADDLAMWVTEHGFRGVRSPWVGNDGSWFELQEPLWKRADELGVPLCILTSIDHLPDVERWARRFESVPVCIDHMAWPPPDEPEKLEYLLSLADLPRVYVKISGTWGASKEDYPYGDMHHAVERVYDRFGPERLMWCTDWPMSNPKCGYTGALELVQKHFTFLNADDREWILGKTVLELWPFEGE